jgi:serum/glucocorticoid-regulated kinase 2
MPPKSRPKPSTRNPQPETLNPKPRCGELPFYNENTRLAYQKLLTCDLEFPENVEVSDVAKDLLRKLLAHDPKERLGCKEVPDIDPDGVNSIKEHTFFRGVDFDKVLSMEVRF